MSGVAVAAQLGDRVLPMLALAMLVLACDGATVGQTEHSPSTAPPNEAAFAAEPSSTASEAPHAAADPPTSLPASTPYERKAWQHWVDEDRDCQDARTEVLITESFGAIEFEDSRECEVESGAWQCPYTGEIIREAHLLDVDHLVPLANAHRSGGASWTPERRRRYANELGYANHLVAVDYGSNRSKGDKGPEAWLPPSEEFRCTYVREWKAIKAEWKLSMTEAEAAAVAAALETCAAGKVPELPQAQAKPSKHHAPRPEPSSAASESGECCRVCSKGKACGDGCISRESTCTKPPGCACDG